MAYPKPFILLETNLLRVLNAPFSPNSLMTLSAISSLPSSLPTLAIPLPANLSAALAALPTTGRAASTAVPIIAFFTKSSSLPLAMSCPAPIAVAVALPAA